jgi:hypothetical protein
MRGWRIGREILLFAQTIIFAFAHHIPNFPFMAGFLGLFDQKSTIAVTMPIVTAFKFCIGHRKMGSWIVNQQKLIFGVFG